MKMYSASTPYEELCCKVALNKLIDIKHLEAAFRSLYHDRDAQTTWLALTVGKALDERVLKVSFPTEYFSRSAIESDSGEKIAAFGNFDRAIARIAKKIWECLKDDKERELWRMNTAHWGNLFRF